MWSLGVRDHSQQLLVLTLYSIFSISAWSLGSTGSGSRNRTFLPVTSLTLLLSFSAFASLLLLGFQTCLYALRCMKPKEAAGTSSIQARSWPQNGKSTSDWSKSKSHPWHRVQQLYCWSTHLTTSIPTDTNKHSTRTDSHTYIDFTARSELVP